MAAGDPVYGNVASAVKPYESGSVAWLVGTATAAGATQKFVFKNVTGNRVLLLVEATGVANKKLTVKVDGGDEYASQDKTVLEYTFTASALTITPCVLLDTGYHKGTETIDSAVCETVTVEITSTGSISGTNQSTKVTLVQL